MLFKRYHIYPMYIGMKVYTRRRWKKPHVKIGNWYDVTHKMMYSPEDFVERSLEQHDTAIRTTERNATLDELKAWFVKNKCNGCPYGGNLLAKIESLRGKP